MRARSVSAPLSKRLAVLIQGYMFGKGVYFADMSSKSANYCFATKGNAEGVMLLSEVALGDMHELLHANERLPKVCVQREGGKRACVSCCCLAHSALCVSFAHFARKAVMLRYAGLRMRSGHTMRM